MNENAVTNVIRFALNSFFPLIDYNHEYYTKARKEILHFINDKYLSNIVY